MIFKELAGFCVHHEGVDRIRMTGPLPSVLKYRAGMKVKDSERMKGTPLKLLEESLLRLNVSKRRSVFLTLPRELFFSRNVRLSGMSLEDAVDSVKNNISIYSHLPAEEIVFDIFFNKNASHNKTIELLVYYASRKDIEPYLHLFRKTGHIKSLVSVTPFSFSLCAWSVLNGYARYKGIVIKSGNACEFASFTESGPLNSYFHTDEKADDVCAELAEAASRNGEFRIQDFQPFEEIENSSKFKKLPRPEKNMAVAAIAPFLLKLQKFSLDGTPPKLKFFNPAPLRVMLCLACAVSAFYMYDDAKQRMNQQLSQNKKLSDRIEMLENRIKPMEDFRETLKKAEGLRGDVEQFMKSRPDLYRIINEVASLVPEGTWFDHSTYSDGKFTFHGESKKALEVVNALRQSDRFEKVELLGSVNRTNTGIERFRVEIRF